MRRILTDNIMINMCLARPVYTGEGVVLLNEGTVLEDYHIDRIKKLKIKHVFVEDKISEDLKVALPVSDEIVVETRAFISTTIDKLSKGYSHVDKSVFEKVSQIVGEVTSRKEVIYNVEYMRNRDDYLYGHSVNVAILSTIVGKVMDYNDKQLRHLALGALLHDVGKAFIDKKYHFKSDDFTPEEMNVYKSYVRFGYETIRDLDSGSMLSANIALSHKERYDGTGFPFNKTGKEIHEYVRIVSVANDYDNIKCFNHDISNHEALEMLAARAYSALDPDIIKIFTRTIAPYPVGTMVELSDGRRAVVKSLNASMPSRPVIRILNSEDLRASAEVDMLKELNIVIKREIN